MQSPTLPKLDPATLTYLLAGGAGALLGGAATMKSAPRAGESRNARRWRILRNALLVGGAGAGGAALLHKGIEKAITQPLPVDDVNPTQKAIYDAATGTPGAAVAAGTAGTLGYLRSGREERMAADALLRSLGGDRMTKSLLPREEIKALWGDHMKKVLTGKAPALTQLQHELLSNAGLNLDRLNRKSFPKANIPLMQELGTDAKILGRRLSGIGRSGGIASRAGILAASAALPMLAAYLTKPEQ